MGDFEEVAFVDDKRGRIVDLLLERYEQVQHDDTSPRIVLLEGESGVGKSRIIREFYTRLQLQQEGGSEGYWATLPKEIPGAGYGEDRFGIRKRLGPGSDFRRGPHPPSFSWWTLNCQAFKDGEFLQILDALLKQASAHGRFYKWKIDSQSRIKGYARDFRKRLPDLAKEVSADSAVSSFDELVKLLDLSPVPFAGTIAGQVLAFTGDVRKSRKTTKDLSLGGQLDAIDTPVADLYANLMSFCSPRLPMILVVEDLHLMDMNVYQLLEQVGNTKNPKSPLLVVATAWASEKNSVYATFRDNQSIVESLPVEPMQIQSLMQIVRHYVPNANSEVASRVAERWTNPYALQLMLTDSAVCEEFIENGAFENLTEDALQELPDNLYGWFMRRWEDLTEGEQAALKSAITALPDGAANTPQAWPFIIDVVAEARARSQSKRLPSEKQDVAEALDRVSLRREWLMALDGKALVAFTEWALARIASEHAERDARFRGSKREAFLGVVSEVLADRIGSWINLGEIRPLWDLHPSPPSLYAEREEEAKTACSWLLAISLPNPNSVTHASAALYLARQYVGAYLYTDALDVLEPYDHTPLDAAERVNPKEQLAEVFDATPLSLAILIRELKAEILVAVGDVDNAETLLVQLRDEQADNLQEVTAHQEENSQSGANLRTKDLWLLGQFDEALKVARKALANQEKSKSRGSGSSLRSARSEVVYFALLTHHFDEALQQAHKAVAYSRKMESLAEDLRDMDDSPWTNALKQDETILAVCLAESGDMSAAVEVLQTVADFQYESGWPLTLYTMWRLGAYHVKSGSVEHGMALIQAAALESPFRPFLTSLVIATTYESVGDLDAAIAELRKSLNTRETVETLHVYDTLTASSMIAGYLAMKGNIEKALNELAKAESGHLDPALAELATLEREKRQSFDPRLGAMCFHDSWDDPVDIIFKARATVIRQLLDSGDTSAALEQSRRTLHYQETIWGTEHREALATRDTIQDLMHQGTNTEEQRK